MLQVYKDAMADSKDFSAEKPDVSCLKAKVRQLLWRDPHQLYQRLEAIVKDCVLEQKVKLIKLLKSQAKNPSLAQDFIQSKFASIYTHFKFFMISVFLPKDDTNDIFVVVAGIRPQNLSD